MDRRTLLKIVGGTAVAAAIPAEKSFAVPVVRAAIVDKRPPLRIMLCTQQGIPLHEYGWRAFDETLLWTPGKHDAQFKIDTPLQINVPFTIGLFESQ